ncbi:hypothetical protein BO70DRAFT_433607 [Aspergillus heteromorphus CBS 117.55]|uniref:Actin-like ATPase domain-containing protein n=1 Tax=Aspergillus heteromorphus CBS 117.55 TaxID=1448321 RepID=A0A317UWA1_9EURO|nr:uncharacterized protein BO70DRAFT_433607 [Aspergillus heteromorphus CBS 117.55]PWY64250.1 hypothetical protein BO70DRAFT_433607 [Aspergillus heteromorphus CBS 117.55]
MQKYMDRWTVGIDFGATKTVLTYKAPGEEDIIDWNHPSHPSIIPIPSSIAYGDNGAQAWGHDIGTDMPAHRFTKLLLDDLRAFDPADQRRIKAMVGARSLDLPPGTNCTIVVGHYLRQLRQTFEEAMRVQWHLPCLPPFDWWFTLPVNWSFEAEINMRTAVEAAGFYERPVDTVHFLSEAEAAMAFVASHQPGIQQVGETVMVSDNGGHRHLSWLMGVGPLAVRQLTMVTGIMGGGIAIDLNLYDYLVKNIRMPIPRVDTVIRAKKQFIDPEMPIFVGNAINRIVEIIVQSITAQLIQVGERKLPPICILVLVGGLSRSCYIRDRITQHIQQLDHEIETIVGKDPILAVGRGATLRGVAGITPQVYDSLHHYALAVPTRGADNDQAYASSRHPVITPGRRYVSGQRGSFVAEMRFDERDVVRLGVLRWTDEPGAGWIAEFTCDLSEINLSYLNCSRTRGVTIYRLDIQVQWEIVVTIRRALRWVVRAHGIEVARKIHPIEGLRPVQD